MTDEDLHDFSPKGREAFVQSAGRLRTMLRDSARQVTQQGQADTTSAEHVSEAYRLLIARSPSRHAQMLGAMGMLLLGVGLSQFAAMAAAGQYSPGGVWIAVVSGVVGEICAPLPWLRSN